MLGHLTVRGCVFCGYTKLDTLSNGQKYCENCNRITTEAEIVPKTKERS